MKVCKDGVGTHVNCRRGNRVKNRLWHRALPEEDSRMRWSNRKGLRHWYFLRHDWNDEEKIGESGPGKSVSCFVLKLLCKRLKNRVVSGGYNCATIRVITPSPLGSRCRLS